VLLVKIQTLAVIDKYKVFVKDQHSYNTFFLIR